MLSRHRATGRAQNCARSVIVVIEEGRNQSPSGAFCVGLTRAEFSVTFAEGQSSLPFLYSSFPSISQLSIMAMITASQGRLSVSRVCRAELPVA